MKFRIAGIGEILWDNFEKKKVLGGAPANFCFHAQALGAQVYIISCVGNDSEGLQIRQKLHMSGITDKYIATDQHHPTGSVKITVDKTGQPEYIITESVAYDYIPLLSSYNELGNCLDAVCFGTLAQRSEVSARNITGFLKGISRSIPKVLDLNIRQSYYSKEIIEQSLRLCSILKMNEYESEFIADILRIKGRGSQAIRALMDWYELDLVALTRGEHGSIIFSADQEFEHPGVPVKVCNTVGAGDAFTAALVIGLLRGDSLALISEDANRVASMVCQMDGAIPQ